MKKCFWKPLALVHKLEHSLKATTFYKKTYCGVIPVHSGVIPVHSGSFRSIPVHSGPFRCHSGSFRSILVHSGVIPVHSGPFRSIPPHSGSFRSISVFSNARLNTCTLILVVSKLLSPGMIPDESAVCKWYILVQNRPFYWSVCIPAKTLML